tara:strand:- start:333 stop:722 length:390 start_codon:yes stop_codon:yes gene_type:complete
MRNSYKHKRNKEIFLNYQSGQTCRELAWVYQISYQRVQQIVNKEKEFRKTDFKRNKDTDYKEIINRLEAIYETLWTLDSQKQLMKALKMFTELIVKQTEVAEKQQKLLKRIEKYLNDENDETENEILFS